MRAEKAKYCKEQYRREKKKILSIQTVFLSDFQRKGIHLSDIAESFENYFCNALGENDWFIGIILSLSVAIIASTIVTIADSRWNANGIYSFGLQLLF